MCVAMVDGEAEGPGRVWKIMWPDRAAPGEDEEEGDGEGAFKTARAPPRGCEGRGVWGPHIVVLCVISYEAVQSLISVVEQSRMVCLRCVSCYQ